jgi:hypothetical protein
MSKFYIILLIQLHFSSLNQIIYNLEMILIKPDYIGSKSDHLKVKEVNSNISKIMKYHCCQSKGMM